MFRFCVDVSKLAQAFIERHMPHGRTALDATVGNGHDTVFLLAHFEKVYAFDIQESALARFREHQQDNLVVVHDSHHKLRDYIIEPLDCIMYNLGYLPGGNKSITTRPETTIASLSSATEMLRPGGLMTLALYLGHETGAIEAQAVSRFLAELPKAHFAVLRHSYHNRDKNAPLLMVVEKKG